MKNLAFGKYAFRITNPWTFLKHTILKILANYNEKKQKKPPCDFILENCKLTRKRILGLDCIYSVYKILVSILHYFMIATPNHWLLIIVTLFINSIIVINIIIIQYITFAAALHCGISCVFHCLAYRIPTYRYLFQSFTE